MQEKVKLPREVAEKIVKARRTDTGSECLFDIPYMKRVTELELPDAYLLEPIYRWYENNKADYFKALIEGYELENTPVDELKKFYSETVKKSNEASVESAERPYYNGMWSGVERTLEILHIKIEGVNT